MAHDPLLSLALVSSKALRPSMSRRLTSLPRAAPTAWLRLLTASTTSGSGLFHSDWGSSPTHAPVPTDAMGGALENTSASGPMPTSRYWDHCPRACSSAFSAMAWGEEHTSELQSRENLVCRLLLEKKNELQGQSLCKMKLPGL